MHHYEEQGKLTTQIGALPFSDVNQAVAYSLKHDIPFLPELTALGDAMLDYVKNPGKLSCLEAFKRNRFETVKIQCIGPATLRSCGYDENDAISKIYQHVETILDGLLAEEILLFLDEPGLGYVGFEYKRLWGPIFESFPVVRGVHLCCNMQWDQLFEAEIDIISFDASSYDIGKYYDTRTKMKIGWGIESVEDITDYQPGDLITLPCGMPHVSFSENQAMQRLEFLREAANAVISTH